MLRKITSLALIAFAVSSFGQSLYYGTDFNNFNSALLDTQQGWVFQGDISPNTNFFTLVSAPTRSGATPNKVVNYDMKTSTLPYTEDIFRLAQEPNGTYGDTYVVSAWVKVASDTRSGAVNKGRFGIETYGIDPDYSFLGPTPDGVLTIGADGKVTYQIQQTNPITITTTASADTWHRLELIESTGKGSGGVTRASIDGLMLFGTTAQGSPTGGGVAVINEFSGPGLAVSRLAGGTNIGSFDDVAVTKYPKTGLWVGGVIPAGGLLNYSAGYAGIGVTVTFVDKSTSVSTDVSTTMDADGYFAAQAPGRADYDIYVKPSHWLRAKSATPVLGSSYSTTAFTRIDPISGFVNGDVDGNNIVNINDYAILSDAFNTIPSNPAWDARADLDGNLSVNINDYAILSDNFNQAGA